MFRLTITLLLTACCATTNSTHDAGTPWARCYTPCGMRANDGDCESLQRFEARAVKTLAMAIPEWREQKVCAGLKGYEIKIHTHDPLFDHGCSKFGWKYGGKGCISGLTSSVDRTITLSETDWAGSSLAHEIAHVADGVKPGHCPWGSPRLQAAFYELTGYVDGSAPEAECSH